MSSNDLLATLTRIAEALERSAPPPLPVSDLNAADAFVWHPEGYLQPVDSVAYVDLRLLQGIRLQRDQLVENTRRFAAGLPANNALLWGARGMGKSSLVKAVHAAMNRDEPSGLVLVEIHREDLETLPRLLGILRAADRRIVLFCDDLSFDSQDTSYKSLKAVLEGGIEGRPENVVFYATSNRRHLLAREAIENEQSTALIAGEAVEEKVSLSDRFGLWLGFHACNQATYLEMIEGYVTVFDLGIPVEEWRPKALEWSVTRGSRSGRVAWQFVQDLAGKLGRRLEAGPPG